MVCICDCVSFLRPPAVIFLGSRVYVEPRSGQPGRPDAVPACGRAAEMCTDANPLLPLRIGTEAPRLRLCQSALTRAPAAPAAELSPAATTCAPGWHSAAVLLPAPCGSAPPPGDHSPCMPCLSCGHAVDMPAGVCDVSVWASAWVRVCVHACLCARAHVCARTYRRDYPRTSMLSQ